MKIGVLVHDAGGANVIFSFLKQRGYQFSITILGPALKIDSDWIPRKSKLDLANFTENFFDLVIFGLNEYVAFEKQFTHAFRARGSIICIFLDHWSFTPEDFLYENNLVLPDIFIVSNVEARSRVRSFFPLLPIIMVPDFYILEMKKKFLTLEGHQVDDDKTRVLYLYEPIERTKNATLECNYSCGENCKLEIHVLEYFLQNISLLRLNRVFVVLRLHPSQSYEVIEEFPTKIRSDIVISSEPDLIKDIACAQVVVGAHTMGLVVAKSLGKTVYCSLPPLGGMSAIQGTQIPYLRDLH